MKRKANDLISLPEEFIANNTDTISSATQNATMGMTVGLIIGIMTDMLILPIILAVIFALGGEGIKLVIRHLLK